MIASNSNKLSELPVIMSSCSFQLTALQVLNMVDESRSMYMNNMRFELVFKLNLTPIRHTSFM